MLFRSFSPAQLQSNRLFYNNRNSNIEQFYLHIFLFFFLFIICSVYLVRADNASMFVICAAYIASAGAVVCVCVWQTSKTIGCSDYIHFIIFFFVYLSLFIKHAFELRVQSLLRIGGLLFSVHVNTKALFHFFRVVVDGVRV